ncbi:MAG: protein translocase subunit SecF, partial [bacterium]|nr:protein translocase subunit SecF [bacterium]
MKLNIIGKRYIFLTFSGIIVAASVAAVGLYGFQEGIDFKGGTLWQFKTGTDTSDLQNIEGILKSDLGASDARINYDLTHGSFLARLPVVDEPTHQRYAEAYKAKYSNFEELGFQSIGPSVGSELRKNSLIALVMVLVGISLYIAFAFRKVYKPVSSWKYGWVTLATLFHDVAIPAGMLAILGHYAHVEIDSNFIVALLVVMGFSVHDTIVVFDRIRENLFLDRGKNDFGHVVNASVNQTMARSINTSLTLILVLIALYVAGPVVLRYFVLT